MKIIVRIISALVLGSCLVGTASAAFVLPVAETYVGYIGNLDIGRLDGSGGVNTDIGTDWISSPGEQNNTFISNANDQLDPMVTPGTPVVTTHWYKFALNNPAQLMDFIELGLYADLEISFFHDSATYGGAAFETITRNDPHNYQLTSPTNQTFAAGFWWMKIVGTANNNKSLNYTVRLSQVPLPPAILLFVSALAGFGVMGRKKKQRITS